VKAKKAQLAHAKSDSYRRNMTNPFFESFGVRMQNERASQGGTAFSVTKGGMLYRRTHSYVRACDRRAASTKSAWTCFVITLAIDADSTVTSYICPAFIRSTMTVSCQCSNDIYGAAADGRLPTQIGHWTSREYRILPATADLGPHTWRPSDGDWLRVLEDVVRRASAWMRKR
jgi:hypothetical protein